MGIKATFNFDTDDQLESLQSKILNAFIMAGEKFVKDAREQVQDHAAGTYLDQTANLRNSIGYFIFHNGELVHENSTLVSNKEQVEVFKNISGFQLIGIAGMNYASYVEAKGYNVISYQADTCMVDLSVYLETLGAIEEGSAARIEESFLPDDLPDDFFIRG